MITVISPQVTYINITKDYSYITQDYIYMVTSPRIIYSYIPTNIVISLRIT